MSYEYDKYLVNHRDGVAKAFYWLNKNIRDVTYVSDEVRELIATHDASKYWPEEYNAYDAYFYGNGHSDSVVQEFNKAWLHHIHHNPHHWQYWVLIQDDFTEIILIDMPMKYVIEMICDWWSFSWTSGNLYEIFDWYDTHKIHIALSRNTRRIIEDMLKEMKNVLDAQLKHKYLDSTAF